MGHVTSKLIEDAITQLNDLGKTVRSLSIHWVEAHKGHAGNEKGDEMTRAAEYRKLIDDSIDTPVGYDKKYIMGRMLCTMDKILPETRHKQNQKNC